jgi:tetratricopeptide (TPR) repeat protein
MAVVYTDGLSTGAPILREALNAVGSVRLSPNDADLLGRLVGAARQLWDYGAQYAFAEQCSQGARDSGVLRLLPWALDPFAVVHIHGGNFATAASLIGEALSIVEATRSSVTLYAPVAFAALRGHEAEAKSAIAAAVEDGRSRGHGMTIKYAGWAEATLWNGLGRYEDALTAAANATKAPVQPPGYLALAESVEAAARAGRPEFAAEALERLSESTQASGSDWALGVEARCRALLSTGDTAEALYREAIERLDRSPVRPEAARADLVYGEWLRRENRRVDARKSLRTDTGG